MTNTETLDQKIDALTDLMRSIEEDHYPTAADRVQALLMIAQTAESALPQAVNALRDEKATWDMVGRFLGTTRQAAQQLYGHTAT